LKTSTVWEETNPSPVESITFEGEHFYLKRDDLLHRDFSGNKARKFYYYLINDFPHITKILSYGSAQSNAMYSLSVLAKMRGWEFEYYVEHIPTYLKNNPHGNYQKALLNGIKIIEQKAPLLDDTPSTLFIEEGGRIKEARFGLKLLAQEIKAWQEQKKIGYLDIFLPSGTGTTALFLQKYLPQNRVITTPCVGDSDYLKKQFSSLDSNILYHPKIVSLDKKHHFGKLYRENYKIWLELQQQTGVVFDLLYDPLGWRTLLHYRENFTKPILYIHQGGLLGNESMLPRYERKYNKKE